MSDWNDVYDENGNSRVKKKKGVSVGPDGVIEFVGVNDAGKTVRYSKTSGDGSYSVGEESTDD